MYKLKTIIGTIIILLISLSLYGCETQADINARKQQERQDFIQRSIQKYQEGVALFQEMDFSKPDKEKVKKATLGVFCATSDNMRFSERDDCYGAITGSCPNAQELYYTGQCLEIIAQWGSIEKGLTIKDSMLFYYAKLIPENYNGPLKEKVLPLRNEIFYIEENVVQPQKAAREARHKQLQAEYDRTYSERVAKQHDDDPYYDEEYYAEGHYEEDYDDDGYRVDRREDHRQDRHSGGMPWHLRDKR